MVKALPKPITKTRCTRPKAAAVKQRRKEAAKVSANDARERMRKQGNGVTATQKYQHKLELSKAEREVCPAK